MNTDPHTSGAALLRRARLRVTSPRLAVLEMLAEYPHADVDAITAGARQCLGTLSKQAVYDILRVLVDAGLARRIEPAGSPARYETRVTDNHHHVVCRRCHAIADVDCAVGSAPCLKPSNTHDYLIDEAEVTHWGLCPSCQDHVMSSSLAPHTDLENTHDR
ncbi:MAG: Fur family transcriptional regulator [Egibacteraceae bacterium]